MVDTIDQFFIVPLILEVWLSTFYFTLLICLFVVWELIKLSSLPHFPLFVLFSVLFYTFI